jgi:N-acetyl-gamma-glutamyl-phosphate reductase
MIENSHISRAGSMPEIPTLRVGIIGAAGFTGGELIRILIRHPVAAISFAQSKTYAGKYWFDVHADLAGETNERFTVDFHDQIDVLFLCVGHGEAKKFLEENPSWEKIKIIDLSQDYRLHAQGKRPVFNNHPFIYGLPELNRDAIRQAQYIANPGCFATAIQLGLLPLAKAGLLTDIYTTGITGSTGAGQALTATGHFSWRANNIQAYKSLSHQHIHEIQQSLNQLEAGLRGDSAKSGAANPKSGSVHFIPWRGDFTRGIFISSQLSCDLGIEELTRLFELFYEDHPFTSLSPNPIFLKQVVNTNKCLIQLEKVEETLVIHSALDNLLKGASGQAVQNMNLMFGLDEQMGLRLKANYF